MTLKIIFFLCVFIINVTNAVFLLTFSSLLNNEFSFNFIKLYEFFLTNFQLIFVDEFLRYEIFWNFRIDHNKCLIFVDLYSSFEIACVINWTVFVRATLLVGPHRYIYSTLQLWKTNFLALSPFGPFDLMIK